MILETRDLTEAEILSLMLNPPARFEWTERRCQARDDGIMEPWDRCTRVYGHTGPHAYHSVETGEVLAAWPNIGDGR